MSAEQPQRKGISTAEDEKAAQPIACIDAEYKVTKDRYVGGIDPVSKLRHGHGTYTFTNPFF